MLHWRLGAVLGERRLSQREVARRSGLTRNTVDCLAKATTLRRIEGKTLDRLCAALPCQPGELLRWVAEDPTAQESTTSCRS